MKSALAVTAFLLSVSAGSAYAGFNVNVDIGVPVQPAPPPVIVAPAPPPVVVAPPPEPAPPEVYFETAPRFIYSPALGFYVTVGSPYDVMYIGDRYYLYRGGYWYSSPYYNGPWSYTKRRFLPPGLRRHRYEEIRHHRDMEYRTYMHDRDRYRGRWYAPEERREHRRERMEERREHREERREHRDRDWRR